MQLAVKTVMGGVLCTGVGGLDPGVGVSARPPHACWADADKVTCHGRIRTVHGISSVNIYGESVHCICVLLQIQAMQVTLMMISVGIQVSALKHVSTE